MPGTILSNVAFDRSNPFSIYEYSRFLIGHSLRDLFGETVISRERKGKGGLGQMVEELFFDYEVNSNRSADFQDAGVELKCTPLVSGKSDGTYRIKERLVCSMIDYFGIVKTDFEDSHLLDKCRLMLLLFYLHSGGSPAYDFKFIFRILWELPEKDLLLIRKDYETIADKVRRGEAHLLSEGDTLYLGACRKGQKGDAPQPQPYSEEKANRRAFSLKPAYMRYVLSHVVQSPDGSFTNHRASRPYGFELVDGSELGTHKFEDIIIDWFRPFFGLDYLQICSRLGIAPYQAKNKYADVCALIASNGAGKRLSLAEEFIKSGIVMKTVRLCKNGMPKEAMSFKNIDYFEVYDNDDWIESEAYEIFSNRFMFVILKPVEGSVITVRNNKTGADIQEQAYILDNVFFWTMPRPDLEEASLFWKHIRQNVLTDNIRLDAFWSISDNRRFHVRPKAGKKAQLTANPNGGFCEKYCYWFNAAYVKEIIDSNEKIC